MDAKDTAARHRNGAVPEVERDGSETLYGVEHWTQVRTDAVIKIVKGDYGEDRPRSNTAGDGLDHREGAPEDEVDVSP